jgi:Ca2+-binding EF-hand superfamily protein
VSLADADGSGSIDYKEFVIMFSNSVTAIRQRKSAFSASPHNKSFKTPAKTAGKGGGSTNDLEPAELSLLRQLTESNWSLREAFQALDKDGNGSISRDELRARLRELEIELSFDDFQRIFAKLDVNNDGNISFSEFVARYRMQPVLSAQEAKSDVALALSTQYKTPLQAFQAACAGSVMLTRSRLKTFIRRLGLVLHSGALEELCDNVDNFSNTHTANTSAKTDAGARNELGSDQLSFVDFMQLFRLNAPTETLALGREQSRAFSRSEDSLYADGATNSISSLEQALRERIRAEYGTLKSAFAQIDKNSNGVISRQELREALTRPPLNLGFDASTIEAIIQHADEDGNGKIDFIEFLQMFSYGAYQDERRQRLHERRRSASNVSLQKSHFSGLAISRPAPPLQPLALSRFWTMLQHNFPNLSSAFDFLCGTRKQISVKGSGRKSVECTEQDFEAGVARLELQHRLGQAAASDSGSAVDRESTLSPSKRQRKLSPSKEANYPLLRSSWPNPCLKGVQGRGGRGALSQSLLDLHQHPSRHVLAVLVGCPASISPQVCGKKQDKLPRTLLFYSSSE